MENEINVNGEIYVLKSSINDNATKLDGMEYCIVRTYSASPFAGYLKSESGKEVELINARRIWYWSGAASLSQLAVDGTNDPGNCRFPCEVPTIKLTEVIELIPCSEKARISIYEVPIWGAVGSKGSGDGPGYGDGSGDGAGYGDGDGSGDGKGYGTGHGAVGSKGSGSGSGHGFGYGDGSG